MSLKKVLGRSRVSLPVLQTLIVEVDTILNDRPVSPDPADEESFDTSTLATWPSNYITSTHES